VSTELTSLDRGGLRHAIDWIKNDAEVGSFLSVVEFFAVGTAQLAVFSAKGRLAFP
jgi:hypothetical protein